jgi:hypothetical protein
MSNDKKAFVVKHGVDVRDGDDAVGGVRWVGTDDSDHQRIIIPTGCGALTTLTLPNNAATQGENSYLINDGSGVLSWRRKKDSTVDFIRAYDFTSLNKTFNTAIGRATPASFLISEGSVGSGVVGNLNIGVQQYVWEFLAQADSGGVQANWDSVVYVPLPVPRHTDDAALMASYPIKMALKTIWSAEETDGNDHVEIGHAYSQDPNDNTSQKAYAIGSTITGQNQWGVPWANPYTDEFDIPINSPNKLFTIEGPEMDIKYSAQGASIVNVAVMRTSIKNTFTGSLYLHGAQVRWEFEQP